MAAQGFGAKVTLIVDKSKESKFNKDIQSMVKDLDLGKHLKIGRDGATELRNKIQAAIDGRQYSIKIQTVKLTESAVKSAQKQIQEAVASANARAGVVNGTTSATVNVAPIAQDAIDNIKEGTMATADWKKEIASLDRVVKNVDSAIGSLYSQKSGVAIGEAKRFNDKLITIKDTMSGLRSQETGQYADIEKARVAIYGLRGEIESFSEGRAVIQDTLRNEVASINALYSSVGRSINGLFSKGNIEEAERLTNSYAGLGAQMKQINRGKLEYIDTTREQLLAMREEIAGLNEVRATSVRLNSTREKILNMLSKNTRIRGTVYEAELQDALGQVEGGNLSATELDQVNSRIKSIEGAFTRAGLAGKTFGDTIRNAFQNVIRYMGFAYMFRYVITAIKKSVSAANELNKAFTLLRIVTGATDSEMQEFSKTATNIAQKLGKSITDITSSIETFSRLGYSLAESSQLTEFATILSNTANVSAEEATRGITSIVKGYGLDVEEASHIADVLIEVGQKYAVSASELIEAYSKSGAALNATNTSLEKSAGLIAAANASVQNASVVGTALKTVSARIRGSKTDLAELGESAEDLANGFSKYAKEIKALTGFDIMVEGTKDQFKDIYDIFDGLAGVWDKLSDTAQSRVSEILGGTRQLQVISSILYNWQDAVGAYEDAMNSAGTATKANDIYLESTAAHIEQLKAKFQELSATTFKSESMNALVDAGGKLLSIFNFLVKNGGALPVAIALFMGFNGVLNSASGDVVLLTKHMNSFSTSFKTARAQGEGFFSSFRMGMRSLRSNSANVLQTTIQPLINSFNNGGVAATGLENLGREMTTLEKAAYNYFGTVNQGQASQRGFIKYCKQSGVAVEQMTAKTKAATIGAKALSMALNMIAVMAIAKVISLAIDGIKKLAVGEKEAAKEANEAAKNYAESTKKLDEYATNIEKYRKILDAGTSSKEEMALATDELNKIEKEIIDNYSKEAKSIDVVNGKLSDQIGIIQTLKGSEYDKWWHENYKGINGYNGAVQTMTNDLSELMSDNFFDWARAKTEDYFKHPVLAARQYFKTTFSDEYKEVVLEMYDYFDELQIPLAQSMSGDLHTYKRGIADIVENLQYSGVTLKQYLRYLNDLYEHLESIGRQKAGGNYDRVVGEGLSYLSALISDAEKEIGENEEAFNTYAVHILENSEEYSSFYSKLLLAQKELDDALKDTDTDKISQAYDKIKDLKEYFDSTFANRTNDDEFNVVSTYIHDLFDEIFEDDGYAKDAAYRAAKRAGEAIDEYNESVEKIVNAGFSEDDRIFGNIDLNNRPVITLDQKAIDLFMPALLSFRVEPNVPEEDKEKAKQDIIDEYEDTIATVIAESRGYVVGGEETEIAFTPIYRMLYGGKGFQKGDITMATRQQMDDYIKSLITAAEELLGENASKADLISKIFEIDKNPGRYLGNAWKNLIGVNNVIADIGDNADSVAQIMHEIEIVKRLKEQLQGIADSEGVDFNDMLKAAVKSIDVFALKTQSIEAACNNIEKLHGVLKTSAKALKQFEEDGVASADSVTELASAFANVSGASKYIEDFAKASNVDEAKAALTGLANTYIETQGTLDNLSGADAKAVQKKLELIGVTNAEDVVRQKVIQNLATAARSYEYLAGEEFKEYRQQLINIGAAKTQEEALRQLAIAKVLASVPDFKDMTEDELKEVSAAIAILPQYASLLEDITKLKSLYEMTGKTVVVGDGINSVSDLYSQIREIEDKIANVFKDTPATIAENWKNIMEELEKSSKSLPDKYEEESKALKHALEVDAITQAEYYAELDRLTKQYLDNNAKNRKKYKDEIFKNQEEIYKYQKQSLQNLYDTTKKMVEQNLNDQIDALEKQKDAIKKAADDEKEALEAAEEAYEKSVDGKVKAIEKQIDALEKSANAQKEALEKEKEAMQDSINAQIDALEAQRDAIKETADEEKKAAEERYKAIEKEIKSKLDLLEKERKQYQENAEAKKKALQDEVKADDYEYELAKKQNSLAELMREQASLQNDTSASGQKRKEELKDEIKKAQRELYEFMRDRNVDVMTDTIDADLDAKEKDIEARKDALNDELDMQKEQYDAEVKRIETVRDADIKAYELRIDALKKYMDEQEKAYEAKIDQITSEMEKQKELLEAEKKNLEEQKEAYKESIKTQKREIEDREKKQEEQLKKEIEAIRENLKNQEYLHNLTMAEIENKNGDLYDKLIAYNQKYGSAIQQDIVEMWDAATSAVKKYKAEATKAGLLGAITAAMAKGHYAVGTKSLPYSGLVETDEAGYEIKLNRTSGRHYEFMNSGSVILPSSATQKIMSFISNPTNFIKGVLETQTAQPKQAISGDISAISNAVSAPITINQTYQITGDSPVEIAEQIKKISQSCVDQAFDRLNSSMRKNGFGRKINQMA